ncbi:MAG: hypothetical protein DRP79_03935, partial [Planctomycetota bacterium]
RRVKCSHCGNIFVPSSRLKKEKEEFDAQRRQQKLPQYLPAQVNVPGTKTFICPNPKCNFRGAVRRTPADGFWLPMVVFVGMVVLQGSWISVSVGLLIQGAEIWVIIGVSVLLGLCLLIALVVFITRLVIAATPRWYCPNCGIRLE